MTTRTTRAATNGATISRKIVHAGAQNARGTGEDRCLIAHWEGALERFEIAEVLPDYLGRDFCRTYALCRRLEARHYRAQVPDLDYLWYLGSI